MLAKRSVVISVLLGLSFGCSRASEAPETIDASASPPAIPAAPAWTTVATTTARYNHAGIAYGSKVLVAGGVNNTGVALNTSLTFDGTSFGTAATMTAARQWITLSTASGGKILAAGGYNGTSPLATTELYDGSTWGATGSLTTGRYQHTASTMSSGITVVAGGYGSAGVLGSAEQFNGTSTWTAAGTLKTARYGHASVAFQLAGADRVFIVGGYDSTGTAIATGEIWNGSTWTATPPMTVGRGLPAATLLASGKILVTGGRSGTTFYGTGEVYDPATNTWASVTGTLSNLRAEHQSIYFGGPKNLVLIAGGYSTASAVDSSADWYDPATNAFSTAFAMTSARTRFSLTMLPALAGQAGRVAAIGGVTGVGVYALTADVFGPLSPGVTCTGASDCYTPYCTLGVCCASSSCGAGYTCVSGACATTCSGSGASASCLSGFYCNGSTCNANKGNSATCSFGYECSSGNCVDGVCCDGACGGQCEACNVATKVGTCSAVSGAPVGARAACVGVSDPECGISCNGTLRTACAYPTASKACGVDSCTEGASGGSSTHRTNCNGAGVCPDTSTSCLNFKCGASACKTECASDGDCEDHFHCDLPTKNCSPDIGVGKTCGTTAECDGLTCVDLRCCVATSCAAGSRCDQKDHEGTCIKINGATCGGNAECASGFCTDGVCCDKACNGQCEACDVKDNVGKCTPVVAADPHGKRAACDALSTTDCKHARCDGTTVDKCAGFGNGSSVKCGEAACDGDNALSDLRCTGAGACGTATPTSCVPFTCAAGLCKKSCAATTDCASGFTCDVESGKCSQGATCSKDRSASVDKVGVATPCGAFLCGADGLCFKDCSDTSNCAGGFVCNDAKQCVPVEGAAASDDGGGGCNVAASSSSATGASVIGLCLLGLVGRRSRRRRHVV